MSILLVNANSLEIPLADESVQMVVTSPPYYSLRFYEGTAKWIGGDAGCDHVANPNATKKFGNPEFNEGRPSREATKTPGYYEDICPKCGAERIDNQIGLEQTPEAYIENIVRVFREIRRVLRLDGVAWLNLGDSFFGSGGAGGDYNEGGLREGQPRYEGTGRKIGGYLKPKDLIGIPWRVALALQADGWWLRSDIIWSKKNCMPESVTDRPTRSHEYIFLLAKSERYFYDAYAIREKTISPERDREKLNGESAVDTKVRGFGSHCGTSPSGRNRRTVWEISTVAFPGKHFAVYPPALVEPCIKAGTSERGACPTCGSPWKRNWEYTRIPKNTGHGREAWEKQKERGILGGLGGTSATRPAHGSCGNATPRRELGWQPSCRCYGDPITKTMPCANCEGTGREMVYKTELERRKEAGRTGRKDGKVSGPGGQNFKIETGEACPHCEGTGEQEYQTWPADVDEWPTVPCVVLDPFAGSGTTLMVARKLGRSAVGLDLSFSYLHEQARQRLSLDALDEWENGIPGKESDLSDLPMFAGLGSG